ncbi:uncharacterized protein RHOBADRAFT_65692, partial [Rhodotorula graminis WP1]
MVCAVLLEQDARLHRHAGECDKGSEARERQVDELDERLRHADRAEHALQEREGHG